MSGNYPDHWMAEGGNHRLHDASQWFHHPKRWVEHLPLEGITNPTWMDQAACNGSDPEAWFSHGAGLPTNYSKARQVCMSCPVRAKCLEYALDLQAKAQLPGMWGGLTENQRQHLLRKRDNA